MHDGSPPSHNYRENSDYRVVGVVTRAEPGSTTELRPGHPEATAKIEAQQGRRRDGTLADFPAGFVEVRTSRAMRENGDAPLSVGDRIAILIDTIPTKRVCTCIGRDGSRR